MIASSIIAAVGVGVAAAGAVTSYTAAKKNASIQEQQLELNRQQAEAQNEANKKVRADQAIVLDAQQKIEGINFQQMNLDATRRQREILRQSAAARSAALTSMTATGASNPGSSASGGVTGAVSGREGVNLLGVTQNQDAGAAIFGQHAIMFDAYKRINEESYVPPAMQLPNTSGSLAATGAGLSALGGVMVKSEGLFDKIGTYFSGGTGTATGGAASSAVNDASGFGGFY